jgi:hypothetical protein
MFVIPYLTGAAGRQQPPKQPGAAAAARVPVSVDRAAAEAAAVEGPVTRFLSSSTSATWSPYPKREPLNAFPTGQ